jgi:hypothetical protein
MRRLSPWADRMPIFFEGCQKSVDDFFMELSKQVVSLELAKRLKKLGVKQVSYLSLSRFMV